MPWTSPAHGARSRARGTRNRLARPAACPRVRIKRSEEPRGPAPLLGACPARHRAARRPARQSPVARPRPVSPLARLGGRRAPSAAWLGRGGFRLQAHPEALALRLIQVERTGLAHQVAELGDAIAALIEVRRKIGEALTER